MDRISKERVDKAVDEDGVVIVGHTRYKAALKLGLRKYPSVSLSA